MAQIDKTDRWKDISDKQNELVTALKPHRPEIADELSRLMARVSYESAHGDAINLLSDADRTILTGMRTLIQKSSPDMRLTMLAALFDRICLECGDHKPCHCTNDE